MSEKGQAQVVLIILVLAALACVFVAANAAGEAYTQTTLPGVYAEATLVIQATQTALPFQATQMAEDNRHAQAANAATESVWAGLLTAGKVFLGGAIILGVCWTIAGTFQAGAAAIHAAKRAELPAAQDIGEGFRMVHDGEQLRILDMRTGASWPLAQDMPALPARLELSRTAALAEAMVDIARITGEGAPADWLGGICKWGARVKNRLGIWASTMNLVEAGQRLLPSGDDQLTLALPIGRGDLELAVSLAFEDAALGTTQTLEFRRPVLCSRCQGRGHEPGRPGDPCSMCRGSLLEYRAARLPATFPASLASGARLCVHGEGLPGYPPGDLYIVVRVRPHHYFQREGFDIFLDVTINAVHTALGCVVEVPSLRGPVRLGIPPGSPHRARLKVAGAGLQAPAGWRGDQWVTLNLKIPTRLRPRERALMEQLGAALTDAPPHPTRLPGGLR